MIFVDLVINGSNGQLWEANRGHQIPITTISNNELLYSNIYPGYLI